jgi:hypothetical protein
MSPFACILVKPPCSRSCVYEKLRQLYYSIGSVDQRYCKPLDWCGSSCVLLSHVMLLQGGERSEREPITHYVLPPNKLAHLHGRHRIHGCEVHCFSGARRVWLSGAGDTHWSHQVGMNSLFDSLVLDRLVLLDRLFLFGICRWVLIARTKMKSSSATLPPSL